MRNRVRGIARHSKTNSLGFLQCSGNFFLIRFCHFFPNQFCKSKCGPSTLFYSVLWLFLASLHHIFSIATGAQKRTTPSMFGCVLQGAYGIKQLCAAHICPDLIYWMNWDLSSRAVSLLFCLFFFFFFEKIGNAEIKGGKKDPLETVSGILLLPFTWRLLRYWGPG